MRKRVLASLLTLVLLLAFLPVSALAAEETSVGKWDGTTVDTAWYNDTDNSFTIDSAEKFAGPAKLVNEGKNFFGKTITLSTDIDLDNKEWTPIGKVEGNNKYKPFSGTFDGGGYTIKGNSGVSINANGGTFTSRPDAAWIAPGYVATTVDVEGTTYYTTSMVDNDEAAVAAGCKVRYGKADAADRAYYVSLNDAYADHKGSKMYLLADVTEDVSTPGRIEIVGQGHMFTGSLNSGGGVSLKEGEYDISSVVCKYALNVNESDSKSPATITIRNANAPDGTKIYKDAAVSIEGGTYAKNVYIYNSGNLTINGGTFQGAVYNNGATAKLTVNDGTIKKLSTNLTSLTIVKNGSIGAAAISKNATAVIEGGTFADAVTLTTGGTGSLTIKGGEFNGTVGLTGEGDGKLTISGGYFKSDVTKYCVSGKMAIENTDANRDDYAFKVDDIVVQEDVDVETAEISGETATAVGDTFLNDDRDAAEAVAKSVSAEGLTVDTVSEDAQKAENTEALAKLQANITTTDSDIVTVVRETYLDVAITAYSNDTQSPTVTLDIEPKYNLIATIDTVSENTGVDDLDPSNTVVLAEGKPLTVTEPIVITVELPGSFAGKDTAYVKHTKEGGRNYIYIYTGTVAHENGKNTLTFTNPNGFSTFAVTATNPAAATIEADGSVKNYSTLQDAVDAVEDGQTITVLKDDEKADVSRKVKFAIEKGVGVSNCTINVKGDYKNQSPTADEYDIVSTGSSIGDVSSYTVTVSAKEHGKVEVSPNSAGKGDTVTITVTPDEGYELTGLTVTDANGNNVELTDKGDGTYTFTMPECKVTVEATFTKIEDTPVSLPFVDVDDAENGTVTVTPTNADKGDTVTITAAPDEGYELTGLTVTDADGNTVDLTDKGDGKYTFTMPECKVTVEATFTKIEDTPVTLPFVDVDEDDYFYDAVKWGVENNVTNGTGATTFSPDIACTRAQMVTFLWRASGSPEPESKVCPFTDVDLDSYYGKAVLWSAEQRITLGTGATTFSPNEACTRAHAVTFLCRMAKGTATETESFTDVPADAYYAEAVQWAKKNGVTNGTGDNKFVPNKACTRAEMITFIYRADGMSAEETL